jgi:hypothetical protein
LDLRVHGYIPASSFSVSVLLFAFTGAILLNHLNCIQNSTELCQCDHVSMYTDACRCLGTMYYTSFSCLVLIIYLCGSILLLELFLTVSVQHVYVWFTQFWTLLLWNLFCLPCLPYYILVICHLVILFGRLFFSFFTISLSSRLF